MTATEEIRNPLVLEFLDLKDEYSESDLEDALIPHLGTFLFELGGHSADNYFNFSGCSYLLPPRNITSQYFPQQQCYCISLYLLTTNMNIAVKYEKINIWA
jgi:predicted nuclease of restriction endonuclease-like (RecB) superfamily